MLLMGYYCNAWMYLNIPNKGQQQYQLLHCQEFFRHDRNSTEY